MQFSKVASIFGTGAGLVIGFTTYFNPESALFLSTASSVLVGVGSFFFSYVTQGEKMDKMTADHTHAMEIMQRNLEVSGQEF